MSRFSIVEFIPRNLPSNITLIVTCRSNSDDIIKKIIDDETWYKINLTHFSNQITEKYIKGYLGRFNKVQFYILFNIFVCVQFIDNLFLEIRPKTAGSYNEQKRLIQTTTLAVVCMQ